jgi:uncharacterized protein YodC (DUF2158 family)
MATAPESFQVGDVVKLKSGGPDMAVYSVPEKYNNYYGCEWFAGKKLESGTFPASTIEPVVKE